MLRPSSAERKASRISRVWGDPLLLAGGGTLIGLIVLAFEVTAARGRKAARTGYNYRGYVCRVYRSPLPIQFRDLSAGSGRLTTELGRAREREPAAVVSSERTAGATGGLQPG